MKTVKIKSIKRIKSDSKRYDIETRKTHNFFADGILVHNSCINLHYDWHKDTWFAATTGTAEGEGEINNRENTSFNDLFWETVAKVTDIDQFRADLKDMQDGYNRRTLTFELTTPYNIVVAPHGESRLTLLTARSLRNLKESTREELELIGAVLGIPVVEEYDLNRGDVGHIMRTFENMPFSSEGYVVVDGNFNRIKIKTPAYVAAHHLKGKSEFHHIMAIVKTNEVDEFIATFAEREEEVRGLKVKYDELVLDLHAGWEELKGHKPKNQTPQERKKYATKVFEVADSRAMKGFTGLYFGLMDNKVESIEDYLMGMDNKRLYSLCK